MNEGAMKSTQNVKNPYIKGSKIPVNILLQYFKEGLGITDFLSSYPWIKKSDVVKKLDEIEVSTSSYV